MSPLRVVPSVAGCLRSAVGWALGLLFVVGGIRLLWLMPTTDPVWATGGMAGACLFTGVLVVRTVGLGRPGRRLGLLWFLYLAGFVGAMGLFFPR